LTPSTSAPTPTTDASGVISLFSDAYTNVNVTNTNPNWGQATQVAVTDVITYSALNYQGTEFDAQDVSTKEFFHVDFYTGDATSLEMYVIKAGGAEVKYDLTSDIVLGQWVSVDIPMSTYTSVDLTAVNQLKVVGNGTVVLDNLYFHGSTVPAVPSNVTFKVDMTGIELQGQVPTLQGTFNSWCGDCNPMTDVDNDNIWEITVSLPNSDYEYKYALGAWVAQESVPADCSHTLGANRSFSVANDTVLPTDTYNGCPQ